MNGAENDFEGPGSDFRLSRKPSPKITLQTAAIAGAVLCSTNPGHSQIPALDLPAEVSIPEGVGLSESFTFRLCVRMDSAPGDLPTLATNKDWEGGEIRDYTTNNVFGLGRESGIEPGFAISVLPDGAWSWNGGDGAARIDHRPEAWDQGIADGNWHEIGFAIDRAEGVAHLYHDGRRVALHDLQGVESLLSDRAALQIGSDGAEFEIGAVRFDSEVLSRERVEQEFVDLLGEDRRPVPAPSWDGRPLRVLAWNIWHGGRRKGRDDGVRRVVEVIQESGADIVLMQETYGSGPRISGRLGFDFFLRSANLSVMSRFPIVDTHRLSIGFRFGGVTIELSPGVQVQAYSIWLNYLPSVGDQLAAGATGAELAAADDETRGSEMRAVLEALLPHLSETPDVPVIVGGDFNSGSHLDWTPGTAGLPNHMGRVVPWPAGMAMQAAGFVDTFRSAHPDPVLAPGLTWSPEFTESHQDRIDYVYVLGDLWRIEDARVLDHHPDGWPSDHAAVLTTLRLGGR
jgi:endonuclease/exonuclease/phosphatase family metal-dependent hydrolase